MKKALIFIAAMITGLAPVFSQSINNPNVERVDFNNCEVTRVEVTDKFTVISFEHTGSPGSWVTLYSGIYLQSTTDDSRYSFIKAEGIPLKPEKYYYRENEASLKFKVYFQKLQPQVKSIDIIERAGATNYFNFYGVSLERSKPAFASQRTIADTVRMPMRYGETMMNSVVPMLGAMTSAAMNAQLQYYQQPGKASEIARLNKTYFDALVKEGFTQDQALKIVTATPLYPKLPGSDK